MNLKNTIYLAERISMSILKYIFGFILIIVYHLPRLLLSLLLYSYNAAFKKGDNLTADPKVHLQRAKKLLMRKNNSLILYSALEIRFAAERIIDHQLSLSDKASKKVLKKYDPVKKKNRMTSIDPNSDRSQRIYFIDKETGEKIYWGTYNNVEKKKIAEIRNKLGDLLHPTVGLNLGIANDPWYKETKQFLNDSIDYLNSRIKNNESFFLYADSENFEFEEIVEPTAKK